MVLGNSDYPDNFPQEFEIDYNPENGILIVEYQLPSIDDIPTLKEVKYIKSRDDFNQILISETEKNVAQIINLCYTCCFSEGFKF